MRLRELLVAIGTRAKGKLAFEELDVVSLDEEWAAGERARAGEDEVSAAIARFLDDPLFASVVPFAAAWAENGFPRVAIGTRLAASLMASTVDPARAESLSLPWSAFLVQLPEALVYGADPSGAREAMRLVLAWHFATGEVGVRVLSDRATAWAIRSCTMRALAEEEAAGGVGPALPTIEKRSLLLVRRAILGICAGLAASARESVKPAPPGEKRAPRVMSVGLPRELKSDCREAIHSYVLEPPARAAAAHALVRGTWKPPAEEGGEWSWVQPHMGAVHESPTSVRMRVLKSV